MRQAGTLPNREQAQLLADYLLTLGITAKVDPAGEAWALWIREEDQLQQATSEFQQFVQNPDAPRYRESNKSADALRKQQLREEQARRNNMIEMRDRWQVSNGGSRPITFVLMAASILVTFATDFGQSQNEFTRLLWFQPLPRNETENEHWAPTREIEKGEVWRLFTPIFVHLSPMHLVFNMYWLYLFGSMIESRRGSWRFAFLVFTCATASCWGEYYFEFVRRWVSGPPTTQFGGMSGVGYGLFGYLWMKSRFEPSANLYLPPNTIILFIIWMAFCWTGAIGPVANWAHAIGLVTGAAIGYAPVAWRKLNGL